MRQIDSAGLCAIPFGRASRFAGRRLIRLESLADGREAELVGWSVWGSSPRQRGAALLHRAVCERTTCLRRLSRGSWREGMRFWRFLANGRVTKEKLIEGWSEQTRSAVCDRHVLAIQDTSDIKFSTTEFNRRGLGKVGKGNVRGVLLHAMMAVDADTGACLGLAGGKVWTRKGAVEVPHGMRALCEKESSRWVTTADQGKDVLAEARTVTVIDDREGDFYAHWALTPEDNVHHLSRAMHDRALVGGKTLYEAIKRTPFCGEAVIDVAQ